MSWFASAIATHALVLGFGSGLLFFITGLTVALLARHYQSSRLPVAGAFPLLGVFGVAYGAARWGGVFIPVQSPDLSPAVVATLRWVELSLDLVATAGLAAMAVRLHPRSGGNGAATPVPSSSQRPGTPRPDACSQSPGTARPDPSSQSPGTAKPDPSDQTPPVVTLLLTPAVATATVLSLATGHSLQVGLAQGLRWVSAAPAASGLALALWRQPLAPREHRWLALSFVVLAAALVMEGLAVTSGALPGLTSLVRGTAGLLLIPPMLRLLGLLDLEYRQRLETALRSQTRLAERHALGQVLQDGILQHCYAAGLRLEAVESLLDRDPELARAELQRAMQTLTSAVEGIRRYLEEGEAATRELP